MVSNENTKGHHEQELLEVVKNACFYLTIKGSPYCSEEESIHSSDRVYDYGFRYNATDRQLKKDEYDDYRPIANLIKSAKNTDLQTKMTNFPDFECDNGLIEHFRVTATKENEHGAESIRAHCKQDREIRDWILKDKQNGIRKDTYESHSKCPEQTFDNFICSFKRNWEHHVEKLRKYKGNKENVCFLIESDCFGLVMELSYDNEIFESGITTGKIAENYTSYYRDEHFCSIMLGRCKELLEYIYGYRNEVQYIIFVSNQAIEIIKTDQAQYIASILKKYQYYQTCVKEHIGYFQVE